MDSVTNIAGGGKNQSGQEPISGKSGEGTATQPFDAGNQEENPDMAGKAAGQAGGDSKYNLSGKEPVSGQKGEGTAEKPYDAGNQEDSTDLAGKAPQQTDFDDLAIESNNPTDQERSKSVEDANFQETPKVPKEPTNGGSRWFFNPFASRPSGSEAIKDQLIEPIKLESGKQIMTGAEKIELACELDNLSLDQRDRTASPGSRGIVVEPVVDPSWNSISSRGDISLGQASGVVGKGKGKAKLIEADIIERLDPSFGKTESSSISTRRGSFSTDYTAFTRHTYSTAGTGTSIAGSSRRQSGGIHIVTSQGKPITAGGVPLGLPAMEERSRRWSGVPIEEHPEHDDVFNSNTAKDNFTAAPVSRHQDFAHSMRTPASSVPTARNNATIARRSSAVNTTSPEAEANTSSDDKKVRRRSSMMMKAMGLGRKVRHSMSK